MSNPNFPRDLNIKPLNGAKFGAHTAFEDDFDVQAQQDAIDAYGIAGRVWEASYPMITYLNPPSNWSFDPPLCLNDENRSPYSLLELGSGTGIAASCMAEILREKDLLIVTDLPEVCPLLEKNLSKHAYTPSRLAVRPLAWGNVQHVQDIRAEFSPLRLTHIVCSDLVYFPELLGPLLRSLIHLTSNASTPDHKTDAATVIISYQIRSLTKEAPFWSTLGLWFSFYPVNYIPSPSPNSPQSEDRVDSDAVKPEWMRFGSNADLDDQSFVFIAHRRPESHDWTVPESDAELLQGVGARGAPSPKSDDTFETLLLFCMEDH